MTANSEMHDILREAEADARAFAEGCDDLAGAIGRALQGRKVDKGELREALSRHHARLAIIEKGLHHQRENGS